MTVHGAKALEFDHVYLIGLAEDLLPSFRAIGKGDRSPEREEGVGAASSPPHAPNPP